MDRAEAFCGGSGAFVTGWCVDVSPPTAAAIRSDLQRSVAGGTLVGVIVIHELFAAAFTIALITVAIVWIISIRPQR